MYRVEITLCDDRTLDRVYDCYCRACGDHWEERFSNDGGGFPDKGFIREAIEDGHAEVSQECY